MARQKKEKAKKVEPEKVETPKAEETKDEKPLDWTPPPRATKYRVAKGKSISCRKGIRVEGDPIKAINVGTEEDLEKLVEGGYVEKY